VKLIPTPFFDPDKTVFALDKFEHFGAMLALAFLLLFFGFGWLATLFVILLVAGAFEIGQWDIGRQVPAFHDDPAAGSLVRPFKPGYGFGLLDLASGVAGGVVAVLVHALL
jgi:hypothetical protein